MSENHWCAVTYTPNLYACIGFSKAPDLPVIYIRNSQVGGHEAAVQLAEEICEYLNAMHPTKEKHP